MKYLAVGAFGGSIIAWWLFRDTRAMAIGACVGTALIHYSISEDEGDDG